MGKTMDISQISENTGNEMPPNVCLIQNKSYREKAFMTGSNKNVYGTYIHGIFDQGETALDLVKALAKNKGIEIETGVCVDYMEFKQKQYDKLAAILSQFLNMEEIYGILREAQI